MLSRNLIQQIESFFSERLGRPARYLPSGRLGIYAACCELFSPGSRVILSPVTDDIVLFALLAAGVQPVLIDIDPESGGLLPDRIPEAVSKGAVGVITSNLYGIPDDAKAIRAACDRHQLLFIEDCAHAMMSSVGGQKVGTFGEVSIFSMNKHVGFRGGVVTGKSERQVTAIYQRAESYIQRPSFLASLIASSRIMISLLLTGFPRFKKIIKTMVPSQGEGDTADEGPLHRVGHRVPVLENDFERFENRCPFSDFDTFLKVDNPAYREIPCWINLYRTIQSLQRIKLQAPLYQNVASRIDPRLKLKRGTPPAETEAGFFKIPFFVEACTRHYQNLSALGIKLNHIYSPAFPHYLPSRLYISLIRDEAAVLKWSRDILPIPLNDLDRVMDYFLQNPPSS